MNNGIKNRVLTALVILLLVANTATIAFFWINREKHPPPAGRPDDFLIKELVLDQQQQAQLKDLVDEHRRAAEQLRLEIKTAKETFFDLLKQGQVADTTQESAAKVISDKTRELDLLTWKHFQKIRLLCNPAQQIKFDNLVQEVTSMMAPPRPPGPPNGNNDRPPPPGQ